MSRNEVLDAITRFYLTSGDFNGLPLRDLLAGRDRSEAHAQVATLIKDGLVAAVFGDSPPKPACPGAARSSFA